MARYERVLGDLRASRDRHELRARFAQARMPGSRAAPLYRAAMAAAARLGCLESAVWLLGEMRAAGFRPGSPVLVLAMQVCRGAGAPARALQILDEAEAARTRPSSPVFHEAVRACAAGGDADRTLQILDRMRRAGHCPSRETFNAGLLACGHTPEHWRAALLLFEEMERNRIQPDTTSFNLLFRALVGGGQFERIRTATERMCALGVAPNEVTFNTLINAAGRGARPHWIATCLADMKSFGVQPSVVTWSSAIHALGRAGLWREALGVLDSMSEAKVRGNDICYNAAINACRVAGEHREALALLDRMEREGVPPNAISYTTALQACARAADPEAAVELLSRLGTEPLTRAAAAAAAGAPPARQPSPAVAPVVRDLDMYTAALQACAHGRRADLAAALFHELDRDAARGRVKAPGERAVAAYLRALESAGRPEEADQVYADARNRRHLFRRHRTVLYDEPDLGPHLLLDLHMANPWTVRPILRHALATMDPSENCPGLVLITGYGRHRTDGEGSVLGPAVVQYLTQELSPKLMAWPLEHNPGRFVVTSAAIRRWHRCRRQQSEEGEDGKKGEQQCS